MVRIGPTYPIDEAGCRMCERRCARSLILWDYIAVAFPSLDP